MLKVFELNGFFGGSPCPCFQVWMGVRGNERKPNSSQVLMHVNTDTYTFRARVLAHLLEASGASVVHATHTTNRGVFFHSITFNF